MSCLADRVSVILSVNRALLGAVRSSLRSVQAEWADKEINLYYYFDGPISDHDAEDMGVVGAEVAADFPGYMVNDHCVRVDYPQMITPTSATRLAIFRRKELNQTDPRRPQAATDATAVRPGQMSLVGVRREATTIISSAGAP